MIRLSRAFISAQHSPSLQAPGGVASGSSRAVRGLRRAGRWPVPGPHSHVHHQWGGWAGQAYVRSASAVQNDQQRLRGKIKVMRRYLVNRLQSGLFFMCDRFWSWWLVIMIQISGGWITPRALSLSGSLLNENCMHSTLCTVCFVLDSYVGRPWERYIGIWNFFFRVCQSFHPKFYSAYRRKSLDRIFCKNAALSLTKLSKLVKCAMNFCLI